MYVVCGEALFDFFFDRKDFGDQKEVDGMRFTAVVGGSPFNVALGLARLGQQVGLLAGLSTDFLGEHLATTMRREGIFTGFVVRRDKPTTLSLVGVGPKGSPSYAFYGRDAADRSIEAADLPKIGDAVRALHFGSYSLVATPTADAMIALAEREVGRRFISLDPNVRPTVEPDLDVWRDRIAAMSPFAHMIKISEEDIDALIPGTDSKDFARDCLDKGARLVVVTRGGNGATGYHGKGTVDVVSPRVEVVDTVGAGDTFQAALLYGLGDLGALSPEGVEHLDVADLKALLTWCAQAAAVTCTRRGADLPKRAELPPLAAARAVPR